MSSYITDELKRRILEEVWPGTPIQLDKGVVVTCPLQRLGCQHNNGDRSPSFALNTGGGSYRCKRSGRHGGTWKALVHEVLGEGRWRELTGGNRASAGKLEDRWERLDPEERWTRDYQIRPDLSQRYLRRGKWTPNEETSESVVGIRAKGKLVGIKWRAPREGYLWCSGAVKGQDVKYVWTAGSAAARRGTIFLGDDVSAHPQARVVITAGEKDALVATSHLPAGWIACTGVDGEGSGLQALRELLKGRDVVIAYDPDDAGRAGAWLLGRDPKDTWRRTGGRAQLVEPGLVGVASRVLVARLPEGPAGPGEPKWDVAALVRYRGAAALVEALEAAVPVPPEWKPGDVELVPPGEGPPPAPAQADGDGDGPRIRDPLDSWRVERGQTVEARFKEGREELHLRFAGSIRIARVESVRQEDAEAEDGWREERKITYEIRLGSAGLPQRRVLAAGQAPLARLLDLELGAANNCHGWKERGQLFRWIERSAGAAEKVELVRAIGPHPRIGGWIAPPSVIVRQGKVEKTPFAVAPPGEEIPDVGRYRLAELPRAELRQLGTWVVEHLLKIDHVQGGYVLPILGAVVSAPLWTYLPTLASWQRYALFAQGPSGIGKTQMVRAILSLWGDFMLDPQGLTSWLSSATTIEDLLHQVVAAPVLVHDFKQANMSLEQRRAAVALIQAYADKTSRGRAEASGRSRRRRPPRATLLIDGEDLPEGQQATLGRLLVLEVAQSPDPRCPGGSRCATTEGLDERLMRKLPGLAAAWIAWVQREAGTLGTQLYRMVANLEQDLVDAPSTTNRSRILRNYAIQLTAIAGFATFLEDELGVAGAYQAIQPRAVEVHQALALRQLGVVGQEGAAELFLAELAQLLQSGIAWLRKRSDQAGPAPFAGNGESAGATCVGTYDHEGMARLLPNVAFSLVQAHRTKGGGTRIEFTKMAVEQQLDAKGMVDRDRPEASRAANPVQLWKVPLTQLGGRVDEQPLWDRQAGDPT